jgi:hypothetical protein
MILNINNDLQSKEYKDTIVSLCLSLKHSNIIAEYDFIDKTSIIYFIYPHLFSSAFNIKDVEFLKDLSFAGFLIYRSTIIKDRIIDRDKEDKLQKYSVELYIEASNECDENAIKILRKYYPEDSLLWTKLKNRKKAFAKSVEQSKEYLNKNITIEEYRELSDNKSTFAELAIDALFIYNKCIEIDAYNQLLLAHQHFSTGIQLLDDFDDIYKDYQLGQFNWCLYKLKELHKFDIKDNPISEDGFKKLFYFSEIPEETYKFAKNEFEKAINLAICHKCFIWESVIRKHIQMISSKEFIFRNYMNVTKKKAEILKNTTKKVIHEFHNADLPIYLNSGINALLKGYEYDFFELKHIMWLPSIDGFSGNDTVYVGDVFLRAILGCLLCDLCEYDKNIRHIIEEQAIIIKEKRRDDNIKGWSYLPDAKEIASDIDDLGQIMQFFIKAGKKDEWENIFTQLINTIFQCNCLNDGGIKTWILPINKNEEEQIQHNFNTTKWGEGPDIDAMANFLIGLYLFDENKSYIQYFNKSCEYLIEHINDEGYWDSRWYYGKYYCTYKCTQLLLMSDRMISILQKKIVHFLETTQNKDGGWGLYKDSDSLNTSFALLCCKHLKDIDKTVIAKGINYLLQKQGKDGLWEATNFIKPRHIDPYKSRMISSIFTIDVLLNNNCRSIDGIL